jgi:hypothetical protein
MRTGIGATPEGREVRAMRLCRGGGECFGPIHAEGISTLSGNNERLFVWRT